MCKAERFKELLQKVLDYNKGKGEFEPAKFDPEAYHAQWQDLQAQIEEAIK